MAQGTNYMNKRGIKLYVELTNSEVCYTAGSTVKGHIFLELKHKLAPGKKLILQFKGMEQSDFGSSDKQCGRAEVIFIEFDIAKWTEDFCIEAG